MSKKKKHKKTVNVGKKVINTKLITIIVIAVWIVLLLLTFDPTPFTGGDNAHFWALAESFSKGNYLRLYEPGTPPETASPPGYPALIAIFYYIASNNVLLPKFLSLVLFLAGLYISYRLFKLYGLNPWLAYGLLTICVINIRISEFSHWTLSESPSLFFIAFAIFLIEKSLRSNRTWLLVLASAIATYSVYIRLASLPVLAGFILYLAFRKDWKKLCLSAGVMFVLLLPWLIWVLTQSAGEGNFYLQHLFSNEAGGTGETMNLSALLFRLWSNFRTYNWGHIPNLLFSPLMGSFSNPSLLVTVVGLILTPLWVAGIGRRLKKDNYVIIPFIIIPYLIMLYFWAHPKWSTVRYLIGVTPLFIFTIFDGINAYEKWLKSKTKNIIIILLLIISLLISIIDYVPTVRNNIKIIKSYIKGYELTGYNPAMIRFIEACRWVRQNTHEETTLISRKPRLSYLWGKRPGHCYKFLSDRHKVMADIDSSGADYVVIDRFTQSTQAYLIPAINAYPGRFEIVYKTPPPETFVLKILPKETRLPEPMSPDSSRSQADE